MEKNEIMTDENQLSSEEIKKLRNLIDTEEIKKLRLKYSYHCLLYTSPSPRDLSTSRMPSSA